MSQPLQIPPELFSEMTPVVRAYVESLFLQMAEMQARMQAEIDALKAQVVSLQSEVKRLTPQNSSVPPSTQHPHARPAPPPKTKSGKKRGGQPGHKRSLRELVPVERCNDVIGLKPDNCRRCGRDLMGTDPEPIRHQVWEVPEIKPNITEYQRHRLKCAGCGTTTCAELPAGVPTGQFGARLLALTGLLMGHFRQSKRRAALFLTDLLNMPCSPATTVKMQNVVSSALAGTHADLKARLASETHVFMDESPTKEANKKAWLWTAVAAGYAVFAVFASRAATAVPKILGDAFPGVIHCDRAKMYWQAKCLQWCWAHLKRDFQALIDHHDHQVKRLGRDLMRPVETMFELWHKHKAKAISREEFQTQMEPVRKEVNDLLSRGMYSGNQRLVGSCKELYNHREWLWTFVDVEGLEPTNNTAERALRPAVIYRKLSFGTQSAAGSRFLERMLTVTETCRLQNRPLYAWLTNAMQAHLNKTPPPSLCPGA